MRYRVLSSFATLLLTLPCGAFAQQSAADKPFAGGVPDSTSQRSPLAVLLEGKVRSAWAAFGKKDQEAYARFLTDDFHAVESDGEGERSKVQVLREVEHCLYTSYLLQFFQVQPLETDSAFVTYESSMQFPKSSALRFRRVFVGELWVQRHGVWQMMRYQETLVR